MPTWGPARRLSIPLRELTTPAPMSQRTASGLRATNKRAIRPVTCGSRLPARLSVSGIGHLSAGSLSTPLGTGSPSAGHPDARSDLSARLTGFSGTASPRIGEALRETRRSPASMMPIHFFKRRAKADWPLTRGRIYPNCANMAHFGSWTDGLIFIVSLWLWLRYLVIPWVRLAIRRARAPLPPKPIGWEGGREVHGEIMPPIHPDAMSREPPPA